MEMIFLEFSGLGMQIKGKQNIVSIKNRKKRKKGEKRESMSGKRKDKKNGKDDIRCLDGLKTKRRSMQKLEESR